MNMTPKNEHDIDITQIFDKLKDLPAKLDGNIDSVIMMANFTSKDGGMKGVGTASGSITDMYRFISNIAEMISEKTGENPSDILFKAIKFQNTGF